MKYKIIFFLISSFFLASLALAEDATKVSADNMVYSANKQEVIFEGKVYVKNADVQLWADKITIYLAPANPNKKANSELLDVQSGEIDKIIAEKNVKFESQGYIGQSSKATYTTKNAIVVLEGKPVLKDGVNSLSGEVISYFVNENRAEVQGSSKQRVEAVFTTNSKDLGSLKPTL